MPRQPHNPPAIDNRRRWGENTEPFSAPIGLLPFLIFCLLLGLLRAGTAAPLSSDPLEPSTDQYVRRLIETVKQVKKADTEKNTPLSSEDAQKNAELAADITRMLDVTHISSYSLMRYWDGLGETEQNRFVSTFTELLAKVAYPNASHFLKDLSISIRKTKVIRQRAMVYTSVIHKKEGRIDIDFKLQQAETSWKIVDVYLDGVSLVRNLRTQCLKIIQDHSFEELMRRMEKKIEEKETAQLKEVTGKN